jgi:tetratricopeptide (TPR) repeat protein
MEKAIEIDPKFAMAYRSLSMSYNNLSLFTEADNYMEKAIELADRLPERERFQIRGDFYSRTEKTYDKAIEAFHRLLEIYPENTRGNHNLALTYAGLEQWDNAIERYEIAKKSNMGFYGTYTALATAYRAKQMYKEARKTLEYYLANFGDSDNIHRGLAYVYIDQGQLNLAMAEADKAFILTPDDWNNFQLKGDIYLYQGDLAKAEEEYQKMLKGREPAGQAWGRQRMSALSLHRGKFEYALKMDKQILALTKMAGQRTWESITHFGLASIYNILRNPKEALNECEVALHMSRETDYLNAERLALHLKGLILLDMNSVAEAQKAAVELRALIEEGLHEKSIRLYYHLAGRIALKEKNYSLAIEQIQNAISLVPFGSPRMNARLVDSLATAYYESGDLEKAKSEYERITRLTVGRRETGDIYAKSFYMLGKIFELQGNTSWAIGNYEKFLDLWKDADPGIAEVDDAKKRLAGLKE